MTIAQAAEWLGLEKPNRVQWLRRHLLSRERVTGRAILVRVGQARGRPSYAVTRDCLRRNCPELVSHVDDVARALQGLVLASKRRDEDINNRLDDIEEKIAVLAEAMRRAS